MNRINPVNQLPIDPRIGRAGGVEGRGAKQAPEKQNGAASFRELFQTELRRGQDLRFSAHAQERLSSRNIHLGPEVLNKLTSAVDRAAEKGAQDALVLLPGASRNQDLALVVSVTNRTVITAVDGARMQDNVFTNIDSAVVVS